MAGNYKAHNVLHKINYWKMKGEDPEFLFKGLDLDYRTIAETDWLDFLTQVRVVWENEFEKVPNPREHEEIGYDVYQNRSMGAVEVAAKLVNLRYIFRRFPEFAKKYSLVEHYEVYKLKGNSIVITYSPKKEFYEYFRFASPNFIKGFLKAVPRVHEPLHARDHERIPDAEVEMVMNCFDIQDVLRKDYGYLTSGMEIVVGENSLSINGKTYARRINLAVDEDRSGGRKKGLLGMFNRPYGRKSAVYATREGQTLINLDNELGREGTGFLVLDDLFLQNDLVLRKGEIFNAPYCRFDVSWSKVPLRTRIRYAVHDVPLFVKSSRKNLLRQIEVADQRYFSEIRAKEKEKEAREALEVAHKELENYSENLEKLVEERTAQLKEAQAKLIESEKRTLEHRITGGFAHEMRNALAGAQLEFKTTLNYKDQGKPSAEILKDSTTSLLKNIADLHEEFNIPREKIATLLLPELKTIAEISDHLVGVHADVASDLDRGLLITTQIRDYAKMSELKPGNTSVDVVQILKEYEGRYRQDFERIGIAYLVDGLDEAIVRAEEIHLDSIIGNLIRNAKDALEDFESDRPKEIEVTVERKDDETGSFITVEVSDNGPGIPEEHINEIFEPFFSTKPTSGTGLGLGIVKRLVQLYGGTINVESENGKGTTFTVTLKENKDG